MNAKSPKTVEAPKPGKSSLDMFNEAYAKAMAEEAEETENLPKAFTPEESLVEVVDDDDKHFGV